MSIDRSLHSLFGASKAAADILVQEYGRYFGMRTACFRGGTLTGPRHSATELHGFLAYVMRCAMTGTPYTVFGYKGKQVRDAIHSLDLIRAFDAFFNAPRVAEVYNIGGGRYSHASVLEAIRLSEEISGQKIDWTYDDRTGSATTSGGSPTTGASSPTIRTGSSSTTSGGSSRRSTRQNADRWGSDAQGLRRGLLDQAAVDPLDRGRIRLGRVPDRDAVGAARRQRLPGTAVTLERLALARQRVPRRARSLARPRASPTYSASPPLA